MAQEATVARESSVNPINAISNGSRGSSGGRWEKEGRNASTYYEDDEWGTMTKKRDHYEVEVPGIGEKGFTTANTEQEAKAFIEKAVKDASARRVERINTALGNAAEKGFGKGNQLTQGYVETADYQKGGTLSMTGTWKSYNDSERRKTYNYDIKVNKDGSYSGNDSRLSSKDLDEVVRVVRMNGGTVKRIRLSMSPWIS